MKRRRAIILSPHPDDEVLGCAGILATRPTTVVHITDGVPPWSVAASLPSLVARRVEECEAAWTVLNAEVTRVSLRHEDARSFLTLPKMVEDLIALLTAASATDVFVPAYQGGHPDHDTVYVAAQMARRSMARSDHTWITYSLYALSPAGVPRFGVLDENYPPLAVECSRLPLDLKVRAIREFSSQLTADTILLRWLRHPALDCYGAFPHRMAELPDLPCLYERWLAEAELRAVEDLLRSSLATPTGTYR